MNWDRAVKKHTWNCHPQSIYGDKEKKAEKREPGIGGIP